MVGLLLDSPHVESFIDKPNKEGMTPLMIVRVVIGTVGKRILSHAPMPVCGRQAARQNRPEICEELLDYDADPRLTVSATVDVSGSMKADDAMGFAVNSNAIEIIDQLMLAGVPATPKAEALLNK